MVSEMAACRITRKSRSSVGPQTPAAETYGSTSIKPGGSLRKQSQDHANSKVRVRRLHFTANRATQHERRSPTHTARERAKTPPHAPKPASTESHICPTLGTAISETFPAPRIAGGYSRSSISQHKTRIYKTRISQHKTSLLIDAPGFGRPT